MQDTIQIESTVWPLWRKIIFRFLFIYLLLFIAPWGWLGVIPGADFILKYYYQLIEWAVIKTNANFFQVFHVKNVKVVFNGSGDTSYNWAETCFYLSVAFIGCIVWSLLGRRKKSYRQLNYLLCLLTRYCLAIIAFSYGFQKIFAMQMPFPLQSQLATPLGDLLPMRFSWLFIGYSTPYQVFSGVMEVLVGVLLLYRRTATMGVLVATAVFINVMMLNLSYDIPVKLYSMNIVLMCLYLLANEYNRIACFFILNKPASLCSIYHYNLTKKWMRITRVILKLAMIFMIGKDFYDTWKYFKEYNLQAEIKPIKSGVYDVSKYIVNKDTLPALINDTLRWQDVIFEKGGMGSIKTNDTLFRRRYGRGYFVFTADTVKQTINFKKFQQDRSVILSMHYQIPDSNTIQLWGKNQNDSLYVELKKSNRHFQLEERQFHWLSEANR
jgi:uncharacterized membrane protein YphA (DoxX/SURF4 family)